MAKLHKKPTYDEVVKALSEAVTALSYYEKVDGFAVVVEAATNVYLVDLRCLDEKHDYEQG